MTAAAFPALLADIGGTNARFGWLAAPGAAVAHVRQLAVADHPRLADAIDAYLGGLPQGEPRQPRSAALAVATAVTADRIAFTNSPWSFSRADLAASLGLDALLVINDFEALALALPRLRADQLQPWGGTQPTAPAPRAVVGPGTGLGVGAVVPAGGRWIAVPGEGGHATLAAMDDFEAAVLSRMRRMHSHVSAERVLAGVGWPDLHDAVAAELGLPGERLATPEILQRGLAGDASCSRVIDVFCGLLGGFAGNVALTLGAHGGVYIGGGIVPRLGPRFFESAFRDRFESKGRFRSYLQAIPTPLILDTLAALEGTALAVEQQAAHPPAA